MSNDHSTLPTTNTITPSNHGAPHQQQQQEEEEHFRDIHALTSPPSNPTRPRLRSDVWETSSLRSTASDVTNSSENFTTISREFNALVLAGSNFATDTNTTTTPNNNHHNHPQNDIADTNNNNNNNNHNHNHLEMIGEEETNPLAIVLDSHPLNTPPTPAPGRVEVTPSVQRVKKDEVEAKISAWQNAKVAKVNNRFKREDAVINGWENEQVQKATSWMKKIERKLEEKRAKAMEKMQNDIAKAHRKAEERRASAEAKRGTKVARLLELANLMRAVGKPPSKRSFF